MTDPEETPMNKTTLPSSTRVGFLGAGNIAQAILGGLLSSGIRADQVFAFDPLPASREKLTELGVNVATDNNQVVNRAEIILLCVKPDVLPTLLAELTTTTTTQGGRLFISVAAGVTVATMMDSLGTDSAIVRCMPNTPALVGTGMTAMFASSAVNEPQKKQAGQILAAVGEALWVAEETDLDAVTAVSGSGPAYFFLMMESMINAAVSEGLTAETARQLVLQTALGAARMAITSEFEPGTLREQVTSPGGTTQAAIETFQAAGYETIVASAVAAARKRSVELSGK